MGCCTALFKNMETAPAFLEKQFNSHPTCAKVFAGIGALTVACTALKTINGLFVPFVLPSRLRKFKHPYPTTGIKPWAIVTGASDGIGKGFVFELAAQGFDVVLTARNKVKLEVVVKELLKEFPGTKTKVWVADAANITSQGETKIVFEELLTLIAGLPVTVLVNNVGIGNPLKEYQDLADEEILNVINVCTTFPSILTKYLIPVLESNGPSLIINVGSCVSESAVPYIAVYSGAKAYNKVWSNALRAELRAKGSKIQVQSLIVGEVQSNLNKGETSILKPSSRKFARSALRVSTAEKTVTPYFWHKLGFGCLSLMPDFVRERLEFSIVENFRKNIAKQA